MTFMSKYISVLSLKTKLISASDDTCEITIARQPHEPTLFDTTPTMEVEKYKVDVINIGINGEDNYVALHEDVQLIVNSVHRYTDKRDEYIDGITNAFLKRISSLENSLSSAMDELRVLKRAPWYMRLLKWILG